MSFLRNAVAVVAAVWAGSAAAEDVTIDLGKGEAFSTAFALYTPDCRSPGALTMTIVTAPKHGKAEVVRGDYVMEGKCKGHKTRATFLRYRPDKGFTGSDLLVVNYRSPTNTGELIQPTKEYRITFQVK
ncbi:hypothetical protein [Oharaeibacter diazotrophicus]|uniref:Lipoprotein n=1 Tax=Oharaeibacter diazotrophicus TaxID=1920512 RepID=A0A4R6RCF3_9HYPH|nr:hypothetical protein [Oharaeibacter diazotrophicus]TDP83356.1 hypothetical protein EDD54_3318 [Oharaeibacter diazotrophicus]BBE72189.1 hypothetical protein OHA_1_01778 [Pleomorphomonas sp. SM30]GLS78956.1 hypothetical protein GCM10007904_42930 [Oharaeibacter diazotrophicus]